MGAAENRAAFALKRATFELKKLKLDPPKSKAKVLTEEKRKKRREKHKRRKQRQQMESRMAKLSIAADGKDKNILVNKELREKMSGLKINSNTSVTPVKKE